MFKYIAFLMLSALILQSCNAQDENPTMKEVELKTKMDSISYAIGVNIGSQFSSDDLKPNVQALAKGCEDAVNNAAKFDEATLQAVLQSFVAELQEKAQSKQAEEDAKMRENASKFKEEGEKFLEDNKNKDGVKVTASGLQYKIEKPGNNKKPSASDEVTVHYKGTLISGEQFDSSYDRGQPATFNLGGVISGWTEGLQLIGEGGKVRLFIPYNLAYGESGAGAQIPPYSTLIFDVELLKVGK